MTTNDEVEGFNIVKAILRKNRKPLCRLHFNAKQKYIGLFDSDKNEIRYPIETLDQIFDFSDELLKMTAYYE